MIIRAQNNLDTTAPYSFVSSNIASGVASIPVKNINSFSASWAIQLGRTGEELCEIVVLGTATPSGTALTTTANTRYAHPTDTPVFATKYNQVIFSRSTTGTTGTAYDLTNGTVSITPDSEYTQFDDPTGVSTYAYKARFRNSVLGVGYDSEESDWITPSGASFYSLAQLRKSVEDNLFDAGYLDTKESIVDNWINGWQEQMNNAAIHVNQDYSLGTTSVTFGTAGLGTITVTDFKQPIKVEVSYNGTDYVNSRAIAFNSFEEGDFATSVYPVHYYKGNSVIGIRSAGSGGTARITYGALPAKLVDDADELSLVLRPYTSSCIDYCLARAYYNDQKTELARDHMQLFINSKQEFINQITPRDQSGVKFIRFDETLSGREDDIDLEYFI